jgi:hypothetical protein
MEGRREEYLANRPMRAQARLANVKEIKEAGVTNNALDDSVLKQEFAAMSIITTNDINFASYPMISTDHIAFATLPEHFNTALDSACTNHIICDRHLFQTYNTNTAVPVKTANCGVLTTLVMGGQVPNHYQWKNNCLDSQELSTCT